MFALTSEIPEAVPTPRAQNQAGRKSREREWQASILGAKLRGQLWGELGVGIRPKMGCSVSSLIMVSLDLDNLAFQEKMRPHGVWPHVRVSQVKLHLLQAKGKSWYMQVKPRPNRLWVRENKGGAQGTPVVWEALAFPLWEKSSNV